MSYDYKRGICQEFRISRLTLRVGRTDGAGRRFAGFWYSALSPPRCRCQRLCSQSLAVLTVAMLAVMRVPHARLSGYNLEVLDKLRAYRPVLTMPYNGHAAFHIGLWSPYLERTGQHFTV